MIFQFQIFVLKNSLRISYVDTMKQPIYLSHCQVHWGSHRTCSSPKSMPPFVFNNHQSPFCMACNISVCFIFSIFLLKLSLFIFHLSEFVEYHIILILKFLLAHLCVYVDLKLILEIYFSLLFQLCLLFSKNTLKRLCYVDMHALKKQHK